MTEVDSAETRSAAGERISAPDDARRHLEAFVASRTGVEAYVEPSTNVTATTVVLQPLTGWMLMRSAGFPADAPWLRMSLHLYAVAVVCWLPVVWLQIRMRDLARRAEAEGTPLPPEFRRCFVAWFVLGIPALFAFLAIFFLMVAKPAGG